MYFSPDRKLLAHLRHQPAHLLRDRKSIGAGQGVNIYLRRLLAAQPGKSRKRFLAQLDPGDVLDAHHHRGLTGLGGLQGLAGFGGGRLGLDDDVLELRDLSQPAHRCHRELEDLVRGHRRSAKLSRSDLNVLVLDRVLHLRNGETVGSQLDRIEPDAHAVRPGAEHLNLPDSRQARDRVLQIDDRVVAQEGFIEPVVVGVQTADQQNIGADLLHLDSLGLHFLGQLRQSAIDGVLHEGYGGIEIGANGEGHRQRVAAVAAAGGLHVDGILDAVDALLDGDSHRGRHHIRARAGVARAHLNRRRHYLGILRHRQAEQADGAQQDRDDGDDVGENRSLDEKLGHGLFYVSAADRLASKIRNPNIRNPSTRSRVGCRSGCRGIEVRGLKHWSYSSFELVSNFGFRTCHSTLFLSFRRRRARSRLAGD